MRGGFIFRGKSAKIKLMNARHVCIRCGKIIEITKGLSHAFTMGGKKYCTWCYHSLFFSDGSNAAVAVTYQDFIRMADPKFIEEAIQKAFKEKIGVRP